MGPPVSSNMTSSTLTDAQVQAIVQSPRSLWDTTYQENSWITNAVLGGPIYILGRLQSKITAENPGMKIAITEYNNGGPQSHRRNDRAGRQSWHLRRRRRLRCDPVAIKQQRTLHTGWFRAFRGFDSSTSCFGDTSLEAASTDVSKVAVYASADSTTAGRYVFVAINRSTAAQATAITGLPLSGTAHLYQMTASSAASQTPCNLCLPGQQTVNGSTLTITLPALSVTTIDVQ